MKGKIYEFVNLRSLFLIIVVVVLFAFFPSMAMGQAQLSEEQDQVTRLDLDSTVGFAADQVFLVISLNASAGVSVGSLENEISFPTKSLSFKYATVGASTSTAGAELKTEIRPNPGEPDETILKVVVSPQDGSSPKALSNGAVANLSFQIKLAAELGTTISLVNRARAWTTDAPPKPIAPLSSGDGQIHVTTESLIIACLFYMH